MDIGVSCFGYSYLFSRFFCKFLVLLCLSSSTDCGKSSGLPAGGEMWRMRNFAHIYAVSFRFV
jgi:hypothetical protein